MNQSYTLYIYSNCNIKDFLSNSGKICMPILLFHLVYFKLCPIKFRLSLQPAKIKRRNMKTENGD